MWLLDANLDIHLLELLQGFGIDCDTAENRGWKSLRNGDLVAAAAEAGFLTLLTRDRLFAESAARAWRALPDLSLVIVTLPQLPSARYLEAFRTAWVTSPIRPQPGRIITWP
jgi:predicted nuclease of predicted toxin-antitoxin system